MGTTSTYNTASTRREKTPPPISLLHEQLPAQALGPIVSLSTHPLVSVAAAACVLALLYLPSILLSPVSLTTTLLLLVAILHLGSSSSPTHPDQQPEVKDHQRLTPPCPPCAAEPATAVPTAPTSAPPGFQQKPLFSPERHIVDWARRGPLEVIYEEYEGELDGEDLDDISPGCSQSPRRRLGLLEGIDSLVIRCYTDDSDDEDSGSDSQEDPCFRWEEEEDEGLIEIALEEDNLIEIDISGCR